MTDHARGTAADRGYGTRHQRRFRAAVLARDPICRCTNPICRHHNGQAQCTRLSNIADHHPRTRRELTTNDLDPDDPTYGRGMCKPCHDHATSTDPRTRGGWNRR